MKLLLSGVVGIMILSAASLSQAATEDKLTCAITKAYACTSDEGCAAVALQDMELPRFISIDFGTRVIASLDKSVPREETRFASVDKLRGLTVLHGVEKRGWSLAIGEESGDLTLSASGDGESFTVFGSCIMP
jgi:hypothetical protein